jgi:hypothetical protein
MRAEVGNNRAQDTDTVAYIVLGIACRYEEEQWLIVEVAGTEVVDVERKAAWGEEHLAKHMD